MSRLIAWMSACLILATIADYAQAAATYEDTVEPYVVKSGDTISHITHRFLGDSLFWRDNWALNPQVKDPDKLRIGQVLQIITHRKVIAEAAEVVEAVNRTEKMLAPPEWQPAHRGDQLNSGDGLRTRQSSTAELRFNTESSLRLEEFSQVFLAERRTTLRGVDRGSVKVERGAVGLVFEPIKKPRTEIELIAGPSVTRAQAEANSGTQLRAAPMDDGGAKVMVYQGKSEVEAAGQTVAVSKGMGTRVPDTGPPLPPVKLLPAPQLEHSEVRWNYSNGLLRWQPVERAAQYVIEVCADPECRQPLQSEQFDAQQLSIQVKPLPAGLSFWRVRALSDQQLDGHNSESGRIQIDNPQPDLAGPMVALQPISGFVIDQSGQYRLGPNARLKLHVHDDQSGLAAVELLQADGNWAQLTDFELSPDTLGSTQLRARDQLNNVTFVDLSWPDAQP
ncbi:LysM peptidoglycan-binding domain-containing protein [Pseudomarimonas arenosa]|uniref:LysM peptidoglycan-binding domain-containing protein n=1 Tax=Pseudomarimonas arenosa TaxID=2774145 RepID=A0AAW3ZMB0_9GAMM|nr:LysM domain-containing protein [Pseudomarimonas arenosa]MBD8525536.1 LysM peptidoglycan-binding domain-containing protein [Pseudomarimonas arenosa]